MYAPNLFSGFQAPTGKAALPCLHQLQAHPAAPSRGGALPPPPHVAMLPLRRLERDAAEAQEAEGRKANFNLNGGAGWLRKGTTGGRGWRWGGAAIGDLHWGFGGGADAVAGGA
jgi:hypothetical protein